MDHLTPLERSRNMAAIKSKDTKPEIKVRHLLHRAGLRYILHDKRLPGKPDLVFPKLKTALFVHGCFWHGHKKCYRIPKSNKKYWSSKIQRNIGRDAEHCQDLKKSGWRVFKLWECEISDKKIGVLKNKISAPASQ